VRQQKALAPIDAAAPPDGRQRGRVQMVRLDLRDRAGEKFKDGRHVGLDFYDLLIEVFTYGVRDRKEAFWVENRLIVH
jgi:hypothetical protein